jgi:general secretion pathway protein K
VTSLFAGGPAESGQSGLALIQALGVIALCASLLMGLMSLEQEAVRGSLRFSDASQAQAYVAAAELSAIAALRRDGQESADDHPGERWAHVTAQDVSIPGGSFSALIKDEQGRFNINNLVRGGLAAEGIWRAIVRQAGLAPTWAEATVALLRGQTPLRSLESLQAALGMPDEVLAALSPLVVALPEPSSVNLNSARPELLAALLNNPALARLLADRRARKGSIDEEDLRALGLSRPVGAGFSSTFFSLETTIVQGEVSLRAYTLLHRRTLTERDRVVVVGRRYVAHGP